MSLMQDPVTKTAAVTPSDTTNLGPVRGIYAGVSGNIAVRCKGDAAPTTLVGIAAGVWHPMRAEYIYSTGTTATDIVAGY